MKLNGYAKVILQYKFPMLLVYFFLLNVIWQVELFFVHTNTRHVDLMREILYAQGEERSYGEKSTSVLPTLTVI